MKITIVSPAYPLRGGLAQCTGMLYCKLREHGHAVHVITFKRQYPRFLFPGKSQVVGPEDAAIEIPTEALLDSIGPLSWVRTYRRIRALAPDVLVFSYWMPFFAPAYGVVAWLVKRAVRARILFWCHNIIPHERRPGDRVLTKWVLKRADAFLLHTRAVTEQLLSFQPAAEHEVVPLPVPEIFGTPLDKHTAREKLGVRDERILLFFGYVRPYKGLDLLLQALPVVLEQLEVRLLVVGEFYEDERRYRRMIEALGLTERVTLRTEYVPNEEARLYFAACDVVVLPYRSATQSGIVQLAYQLEKPCIVTDVGGLAEMVQDGQTGYVVPPESPKALAEAVLRFYRENREEAFVRNVQRERKKYSWEHMVEAVETLAGGAPAGRAKAREPSRV